MTPDRVLDVLDIAFPIDHSTDDEIAAALPYWTARARVVALGGKWRDRPGTLGAITGTVFDAAVRASLCAGLEGMVPR